MSLFEYAQEVVSRKLEREKPMLTISMGTQPVMPMAQGGGLSSVQNSLNINGQPHRLAYINPNEEDLLKSLGGSGRKIDGIPAYDDSVDGGSDQGGPGPGGPGEDSDPDSGDTTGQGFGDPDDPGSFGMDPMGVVGDVTDPGQNNSMGLGSNQNAQVSFNTPGPSKGMVGRAALGFVGLTDKGFNVNPDMTYSQNIGIGMPGTASAVAAALGFDPSIATVTGPTTSPGGNQGDDDDGDDDGTDAGGDDIIIKEKIAAVKEVPVEDVSDADVARVRQTAEERIAGTNIEDIIKQMYGVAQANRLLNINRQLTEEEEEINHRADLIDSIYGPGSSAGLLGIATNNTGTA
jgi:hypothetical protein